MLASLLFIISKSNKYKKKISKEFNDKLLGVNTRTLIENILLCFIDRKLKQNKIIVYLN